MNNEALIRRAFDEGLANAFSTIIFNMQHEIIYVSPTLASGLGYQRDELIGMSHEDLCDQNYVNSEEYVTFWQNLAAGIKFQNRVIRKTKDNHKVFLEAMYYPFRDENNAIVGVIKICLDISERTTELHDTIDMMTGMSSELQEMANTGGQRINMLQNDISEITNFAAENKKTSLELLNQTEQAHDIINVISDVAYQTRMLAINTAIEAARLENQGGSFAVISKEIRSLSTQVQSEAISIQERISRIAAQVNIINDDSQRVLEKSEGALASVNENTKAYDSLNNKAEIMRNEMKQLAKLQAVSNMND